MNILLTGGTGLIGRSLIPLLFTRNEHANITLLSRSPNKVKRLFGLNVKVITALSLTEVDQQDIIINLAGEPIADKRWTKTQKRKMCQSRWDITQQLSQLIKQSTSAPRLFISGSAIGIYGRQNTQIIDETFTDYHEEFSHTLCAQWEKLALQVSSKNTRVCVLRTGIVLAKNGGVIAKMLIPFKLGLGGYMASGEQVMSWIHIDDMCAAIIHLIEHNELAGVINMTAPKPVNNKVFSQSLCHALSRPCLFKTPEYFLNLIFGEMAELLIYGQYVVPQKLINLGFSFKYPELSLALNDLLSNKK